jgi:integrase
LSALDAASGEVGRARARMAGAREELRRSVAADGDGPARDMADALRRLDALRAALARDVDTLRDRALGVLTAEGADPDGDGLARTRSGRDLGRIAAGLGLVGVAAAALGGRRRRTRRREDLTLEAQARRLAEELRRSTPDAPRPHRGRGLLVLGGLVGAGAAIAVAMRRRDADEDLWLPEG